MAYDPTKVETWRISSSGFWHTTDVNKTEHMIDVDCTWEQAVSIMNRWAKFHHDHAEQVRKLQELQQTLVEQFKANPLRFIP